MVRAAVMTKNGGRVVSIDDLRWSAGLVAALQAFRTVEPDITANQILTLLMIAREPGISQATLADKQHLDINSATAARICAILSERGNRGTEGKGLIEIGHAPGDYRTTAQYLTRKGSALMATVRKLMEA